MSVIKQQKLILLFLVLFQYFKVENSSAADMASKLNDSVKSDKPAFVKIKTRCCSKMGLEECDCSPETSFIGPVTKSLYKLPFPKIVVQSTNGKIPMTVVIRPEMVCSSWRLRCRVERYIQNYQEWSREDCQDLKKYLEELPYMRMVDCTKDVLGGGVLEFYGTLPLLSRWVWCRLDDWCYQHIKEVH